MAEEEKKACASVHANMHQKGGGQRKALSKLVTMDGYLFLGMNSHGHLLM